MESLLEWLFRDYDVDAHATNRGSVDLKADDVDVQLFPDRAVVMPGHMVILYSQPGFYVRLREAINTRRK